MGDLSGIGLATLVVVLIVFGLFYVKRVLRRHFLPSERDDDRRQAMAELLLLQAELQKRSQEAEGGDGSEASPEDEEFGLREE